MGHELLRGALSHPAFTGVLRQHFGESLEEPAPRWGRPALAEQRGGTRRRAAGAGRKPKLVFVNRPLVTLVCPRLGIPHAALAALYAVDRSTVAGAVRRVRSLRAARGFAIADRPGPRIRTLGDLCAYTAAEGVELRLDGTGVQVRRPRAGHPAARHSSPARRSRTPLKSTTFSDHQDRPLFSGAIRPGRLHDQTAVNTEGITEQLRLHPSAKAEAHEGHRGPANDCPDRVTAPPRRPRTPRARATSGPGAGCDAAGPRAGPPCNTPTPRPR